MSCVIPGCGNNQKNSKVKEISFLRCRAPWKGIIKKYRNDPLPKKALICEQHFSPECFSKENGKMVLNAMPTIFPSKSTKVKSRRHSVKKQYADIKEGSKNKTAKSIETSQMIVLQEDKKLAPSLSVSGYAHIAPTSQDFELQNAQHACMSDQDQHSSDTSQYIQSRLPEEHHEVDGTTQCPIDHCIQSQTKPFQRLTNFFILSNSISPYQYTGHLFGIETFGTSTCNISISGGPSFSNDDTGFLLSQDYDMENDNVSPDESTSLMQAHLGKAGLLKEKTPIKRQRLVKLSEEGLMIKPPEDESLNQSSMNDKWTKEEDLFIDLKKIDEIDGLWAISKQQYRDILQGS